MRRRSRAGSVKPRRRSPQRPSGMFDSRAQRFTLAGRPSVIAYRSRLRPKNRAHGTTTVPASSCASRSVAANRLGRVFAPLHPQRRFLDTHPAAARRRCRRRCPKSGTTLQNSYRCDAAPASDEYGDSWDLLRATIMDQSQVARWNVQSNPRHRGSTRAPQC